MTASAFASSSIAKKAKAKPVVQTSAPVPQLTTPLVAILSSPVPQLSTHAELPDQQLSLLHEDRASLKKAPHDGLPTQGDMLCSRCKNIDIDGVLKETASPTGRFIMPLGEVCESMQYSSCPLCRLLSFVFVPLEKRRSADMKGHHLRLFDGTTMAALMGSNQVGVRVPKLALGVCQGLSDRKMKSIECLRSLAKGSIAPIPLDNPHPFAFQAQRVIREKVDFQQLRAWVQNCQSTHAGTCGLKHSSPPAGFRCIDVHTRLYNADIKIDDEYYALSYVWADHHVSSDPENMPEDTLGLPVLGIPVVIEDAITVVQKLGGRFLWVDKYCIKQWDPSHRKSQIQVMDKIYEGATATIIAAPLKNSGPGLPGVSRRRGMQQPAEQVGHHLLASTLSQASVAIAASNWITRGWTYQEAALSERWLVFTDEQVHFMCNTVTSCESIAPSFDVESSSLRPRNFKNDALGNHMAVGRKPRGLWEFFENLHYYKSRHLSNDSDSIKAFQGLLTRSNFKNIWGVPIACSNIPDDTEGEEVALSVGFARGLWWENPGDSWHDILKTDENYVPYGRRHGFPSYSWAGWDGPTRRHKHRGDISSDTGCNEVDQKSFNLRFWVELKSGDRLSLRELYRTFKTSDQYPALSHILHIETAMHEMRIRRHSKSDKPCICDCPPKMQGDQCLKLHETLAHNVRFFEHLTTNEHLSEAVFSQPWNIVPLFRLKDEEAPGLVASLIIDWLDESKLLAQVKGVAYLHERFFSSGRSLKFRLA